MYKRYVSSFGTLVHSLRKVAFISVTIATLLSSVATQEKTALESATEKALRVKTTLVNLVVSVSDKNGKPVLGLSKDNFRVKENDVLQKISFFSDADTPASILILFDVSGSMSGTKISDAGNALESFYKTSHPQDEYLGLVFNDEVRSASVDGRDFRRIQTWLKSNTASGNTALYDGLALAVRKMRKSVHPKRVIIVVSDGNDNNSKTTFDDLRERVKESDALVYAIRISGRTGGKFSNLGEARLEELAGLSGGWAAAPSSGAQMDETFERLALEIRHQYSLAYSPRELKPDGKWRRLNLELNVPQSKMKLRLRTRRGYFASAFP